MRYDNFLEFFLCNDIEFIMLTIINIEKLEAIETKKLILEGFKILKNHRETIESIQDKSENYYISEVLRNPEGERNHKLVEDFYKLDEIYHQNKENLPELNLA